MLHIDNYSNHILHNITLKIADKNLVLLGSNGVGKSTLARVMCGLIPSTCVSISGTKLQDIAPSKRRELINYIPTKLDIYDNYISLKEFLSFSTDDSLQIDKLTKLFGISHLEQNSCTTLSSGEAQLTLIASALLQNARYTILDEPTSNLDPNHIKTIFEILSNSNYLQNKIVITHNLDFAYKLGYDVVYLKDGRVDFTGTSQEFFDQSNLDRYYNKHIQKINSNIVVSL